MPTPHTGTERQTGEHRIDRGNGNRKGKYWGTALAVTGPFLNPIKRSRLKTDCALI